MHVHLGYSNAVRCRGSHAKVQGRRQVEAGRRLVNEQEVGCVCHKLHGNAGSQQDRTAFHAQFEHVGALQPFHHLEIGEDGSRLTRTRLCRLGDVSLEDDG
eukprot:175500-Rhodomonas_salina.1